MTDARAKRGPAKRLSAVALALAALFALAPCAQALDQYPGDTAIYGVSTGTIQPNVLIILDNSGSMSDTIVTGSPYDPAVTYPATNGCQGQPCQANRVYAWRAVERRWTNYISDVNTVTCAIARTSLTTTGTYQGRLRTSGACSGRARSFALGNYINWLNQSGGTRAKIDVAKEVLTSLIGTTSGVRFGLMIFNQSNGGHVAGVGDSYGWSDYDAYVKDMDAVFTGATTNRTALVNTINNITPSTWTPLAETMYEALQYYEGDSTAFNGAYTYATPIEYACQMNYVILITDGMSTEDRSPVLRTICNNGDCDGDGFEPAGDPAKTYDFQGSDYLDDVAKYMYDNDHLPDGPDPKTAGKQNVITYTVGFGLAGVPYAEELLRQTAFNGGGVYYPASSTAGLSESLREILASIVEDDTSFVAPVLPVSPENRTYSGNRVYMGFFKPQSAGFWNGNIKKYGLDASGAVVDRYGFPATNADGSFRDNAVSFWSALPDGADVEAGGAGAELLTRGLPRDIFTYTGTSTSLTDPTNAFGSANTAITAASLGVSTSAERARIIDFVRGRDAYDADSNGDTTETRGWIMGDVLHSRPTVVHYSVYSPPDEADCGLNRSMIFVGANDGMLHAFRDCDGGEAWAFIPQDLIGALKNLPGAVHSYFVDSSPSTYVFDADNDGNIETADGDKVVVIFGQRRGGSYYYALDVSDPAAPRYMWRLGPSESPSGVNTEYSELGESWSEPVIKKVRVDVSGTTVTKVAAFIGAGYDNVAEDALPAGTPSSGRGVYAVEVATLSGGVPGFGSSGHKIWGYTYADDTAMAGSVPSMLSVVDIGGNGYADRVYTGDTIGNIWRFDTGSRLVSAWTGRKVFSSGGGRKVFYRPAVTLEFGYELLFFGTGDRAHPVETSVVDRLYAVKDYGQSSAVTETNLADAGAGPVNIAATAGWYVPLSTRSGEKVLAQSTVIGKVAYYTTYTPPTVVAPSGACAADNRGTARFYALSYLNASAAYNYNTLNDIPDGSGGFTPVIDATDRSTAVGSGIPSGMVTVITDSGVSALVGVGGSLVTPGVDDTGSSIPVYWRER